MNSLFYPFNMLTVFYLLILSHFYILIFGFQFLPSHQHQQLQFSSFYPQKCNSVNVESDINTIINENSTGDVLDSLSIPQVSSTSEISPLNQPLAVKKKVYEPRSQSTLSQSSQAQPSQAQVQTQKASPPVWSRKPTLQNQQSNQLPQNQNPQRQPSSSENSYRKRDQVILLQQPQLLIRFKVPKQVSETKIRLQGMQNTFKQQNENMQAEYSTSGSSYSDNKPKYSNTASPSLSGSFSSSSSSSGKSNYGKKGNIKSKVGGGKDMSDRREGGGNSGRRDKKSDNNDDDDVDYEYEDRSTNLDPFGSDDTDEFVSLSTLPADTLRAMDEEGFSLDEIQMAIFGEFGIRASIQAIRKRLIDDKSDKRRIKRSGKTRRDRAKAKQAKFKEDTNIVVLPKVGKIQVLELAQILGVGGGEVVRHLMMNMGLMVTLTQSVDANVARETAIAFGKEIKEGGGDEDRDEEDGGSEEKEDDDDESNLLESQINNSNFVSRPPVVTIMGHVDHGKTTLLDRIRKLALGESISSNFIPVAPTEAGGITQSISAFKVKTGSDRYVTFIDTPGHAAFSEMRKRGANVTDIVVLVVAADDGIMDQTKECIFAAKAANCPIVVAINKIDKEGADAQTVMTDLMKYDILVEDFGGEVQAAKLSAKRGIGIEGLLEKILLQADVMDLKSEVNSKPTGSVIESRIDKRLGTVATLLLQKGTLKVGDILLAGKGWGKVRKILSDQGDELKEAGPSTPVQVLGFNTIPNAGDIFIKVDDESSARDVAEARMRLARQATASSSMASMISQAASLSEAGTGNMEIIKVPLILKADVSGSVEALKSSLEAIKSSDETATCFVDLVQSGIGEVTASDVAIAAVSKAKIVAFNVGVKPNVLELAKASNVDIGFYSVVYDLLNEIEKQVKETIAPPPPGLLIGKAEIKKSFKVGKAGKVAGCSVIEGSIKSGSKVRIMRGNRNPVYTGKLSSLRFGKETIDQVVEGSECGMSFEEFQDFEEGDIVECFLSEGLDNET